MKKWLFIFVFLLILVAVAGGFWLMKKEDSTSTPTPSPEQPVVKNTLPTTPFTGELMDLTTTGRPVMAVVNNHPDARPQTGLAEADIVIEMIAEFNITRFVALYQSEYPNKIGPIRSARDYFVELAIAYDAFFVAHGYSPDAREMLESGVVDHVNGMQYDGTLFQRSTDRIAPHNSYITMENITKAMKNAQTSTEYKGQSPYYFYDSAENDKLKEQALSVRVEYGTNKLFYSDFLYNGQSQLYSRSVNGIAMTDKETLETIKVSNVLVFEAQHETIDSKGRQSIDLSSGGEALLFQAGGVREIEWNSVNGMLVPFADGEVVKLIPGKTWIHIVPTVPGIEQSVSYTP
ncbi:DUF3048 domain-containing protein [Planococcus halocryophilus]|uniref:DUF3048 domain-containing protein n=1 Tax=Planococcus halocryophilus TaxID=1215089 RepID=UPI001F0F9E08|nr:DUF3048 domain-containing protein [Planococcus halocryophilus]MCH4827437.1 DUF3048 domain-containing protein [Planococcus halocryophilus]